MASLCRQLLGIRRHTATQYYRAVSSSGPVSVYRARTNDGSVKPDAKQLRVLDKLESLYRDLQIYSRSVSNGKALLNTQEQETIKNDQDRDTIKPVCLRTAAPKGLFIHGNVGTGKTMLMDMLHESLSVEVQPLRAHFHSFMLDVLSRIHHETMKVNNSTSSLDSPIHRIADRMLQSSWLIFLDELQLTDYTSTAILLNLFDSLFNKGAVVVATSNRPLTELGAASIQDEGSVNVSELGRLIDEHCNVVSLDSQYDYRCSMYGLERKYFYPLNKVNRLEMFSAFQKCVKSEPLHSTEVSVYGRKVLIPEASLSHGVCRFGFEDLCCAPLGTADYIKICNTFHTIFLHDVPVLYFHNKNEARRLINFIDACYESKVKLYCLAADEPENLLQLIPQMSEDDPLMNEMLDELTITIENERNIDQRRLAFVTGKDEIFAFRRAISRLKEMQSIQYSSQPHRQQHFDPYISTDEDQRGMEEKRRARLLRRLEEERLLEKGGVSTEPGDIEGSRLDMGGTSDWGEEASWTSWQNDMQRRRKQLQDIDLVESTVTPQQRVEIQKRKAKLGPPRFSKLHFWGFGWWENVIKNKNEK